MQCLLWRIDWWQLRFPLTLKFRTNRCNKSSQAFPKTLVNFGYSRWYGQNKVNNLLQGWINIASEHWTTTVGNESQSMQCPNLHIDYHNAVNCSASLIPLYLGILWTIILNALETFNHLRRNCFQKHSLINYLGCPKQKKNIRVSKEKFLQLPWLTSYLQ